MEARVRHPSRWLILAASLTFLVLSGLLYGFPLISETLKDHLDLTQSRVTTISSVGTFGGSIFVVFMGLFADRHGAQISIWIGAAMTSISWALLTGVVTQFFTVTSWEIVCCIWVLFRCGITWFAVVPIALCAQNFPEKDHGKFLGLGKAYLGIGTAFFAAFKSDLANQDINRFMISMMIFIPLTSLLAGWFIVKLPPQLAAHYVPNEIRYGSNQRCGLSIALWYIVALIFAIYVVTLSVVQTMFSMQSSIRYTLFTVMIFLWLCPWILAVLFHGDLCFHRDALSHSLIGTQTQRESLSMNLLSDQDQSVESLSMIDSATINSLTNGQLLKMKENQLVPNHALNDSNSTEVGMPRIFRYWQLYAMYIIIGVVNGTAICFMDNSAQIVESASSDVVHDVENKNVSTALVAIISFGSFFGRICAGFVADYFPSFHCSVWMIPPPILMTVTQTVMFFAGTNLTIIQIAGLFIGVALGWMFTALIVCVSDLWGTRYLTGNFAIFISADAMAVFLYERVTFSSIYDHFAVEEEDDIQYYEGVKCYGSDCYKWTFLICGCCSFISLILSVLHWKYTTKRNPGKV